MKAFSIGLIAGVILQMEYVYLDNNGFIPVRLVDPNSPLSSPYAGRLEVTWRYSSSRDWGGVCNYGFNDFGARVVCYSLGFGRAGSVVRNRYEAESGRIWLDYINCIGSETNISSCHQSEWGSRNCQHFRTVSIECNVIECNREESECDLRSTACIQINRSKKCSCRKGFAYLNETTCIDIDECTSPPSGCNPAAGTCVNTIGGYICSCKNGYMQINSMSCSDINECTNGESRCDATTATCRNTPGSYNCSCSGGYISTASSWTSCTDINECTNGQSQCDSTSTKCVNTEGNYQCLCRDGYENKYWSSGFYKCRDINECNRGRSQCDLTTTFCVDTDGGYNCSCKEGYRYSTFSSCTDVDECESGGLCDNPGFICNNSVGSYHCACQAGYRRENETTCSDINECLNGESECNLMSTECINTIGGSYTCRCKNGFTHLNKTTCMVDESSQASFGIGAIVGSCVGALFAVAAIAVLVLVFCWKRRKEVNQPSQRQSSQVDNGSRVENDNGHGIVYMELDQTALGMGRKTTNKTQIEASTRLPVPKETAQSAVYGNVQSSIYATVVSSSIDGKDQSAIYANAQQ